MGRPTSLTPEVQALVVDAVEAGNYFETAARAAGISKTTLYSWIKRGEADEEPFTEFLNALKEAEAHAEITALAQARDGQTGSEAKPVWTAAMTFLERRHPQRWGRRDPDHGLKTKLLEAELDTLKAKLKLLEAGENPDDKKLEITFRDYTKKPVVDGDA